MAQMEAEALGVGSQAAGPVSPPPSFSLYFRNPPPQPFATHIKYHSASPLNQQLLCGHPHLHICPNRARAVTSDGRPCCPSFQVPGP